MPRGIYVRKNGKLGKAKDVNPIQKPEVVALNLKMKKDKEYETEMEQMRQENEHMKEHLSLTRRVLVDRVDTIMQLLERLRSAL